jgi:hypothetical protein
MAQNSESALKVVFGAMTFGRPGKRRHVFPNATISQADII